MSEIPKTTCNSYHACAIAGRCLGNCAEPDNDALVQWLEEDGGEWTALAALRIEQLRAERDSAVHDRDVFAQQSARYLKELDESRGKGEDRTSASESVAEVGELLKCHAALSEARAQLKAACCVEHNWCRAPSGNYTTPHQVCAQCGNARPTPRSVES